MAFSPRNMVRDRVTGRIGIVTDGRRYATTDSVVHGTRIPQRSSPGSVFAWLVEWLDGGGALFPLHGAGNLLPSVPRFPGDEPTEWPPVLVDNTVKDCPGFEPWCGIPARLEIVPEP